MAPTTKTYFVLQNVHISVMVDFDALSREYSVAAPHGCTGSGKML